MAPLTNGPMTDDEEVATPVIVAELRLAVKQLEALLDVFEKQVLGGIEKR